MENINNSSLKHPKSENNRQEEKKGWFNRNHRFCDHAKRRLDEMESQTASFNKKENGDVQAERRTGKGKTYNFGFGFCTNSKTTHMWML